MLGVRGLGVVVALALVVALGGYAMADDAAKTVTGKSCCGGCAGVTGSCCLLLTDKDGGRWALTGDSDSVKAAFKARSGGKAMTATLAGKPVTKKAKDGKEYKEVKVSAIKIGS
jgi:hypothetical protein